MREFLDADFLLTTDTAKKLYHGHAEKMPIFDFHCHLSPKEIYEDKKFRSVTEAWLGGDHYKWRLMRQAGVDESYITGDRGDFEKFMKYAEVMPYALGNPIYHWTHLELRRFFGITDILSPATAEKIYSECNEKLETMTAREMIRMSGVKTIFTTDDPVDDLRYHRMLAEEGGFEVTVKPAFRPDKAVNAELPTFPDYIRKLSEVSGVKTESAPDVCEALRRRIEYFDSMGCVCSDHALDVVEYEPAGEYEATAAFRKAMAGRKLTPEERGIYKGFVLTFIGREYSRRGWVQQYHIGAMRNNSERYMRLLGPDTGFDAIEDSTFAKKLSSLIAALDSTDELPKTILYCLNPRDNEVLATLINCFQKGGTVSRMQFGSAWWFNDQKSGMERQLRALSEVSLLSKFVGMLTDSRSFLSYTRHEYFRRILCEMIGDLIESGQYPDDMETAGRIVEDICYNNAVRYFTKD